MMGWYFVKLGILLPLIGLAAWGSLKLARRVQGWIGRMDAGRQPARAVRVVETLMLSPTQKLAVLDFRGREILVSASRNGLSRLAESGPDDAAPAHPQVNPAFVTDQRIDVLVGDTLIGRGEIVARGNRVGLRIVEMAPARGEAGLLECAA